MLDNMPRGTITIEEIEMGMVRHLQKLVTDEDIRMFAEVSTDHNPVHMDDDYARDTIFEGRIAHGMLTAGLISAVIGEQLPGHGTVYMGQTLKFRLWNGTARIVANSGNIGAPNRNPIIAVVFCACGVG